MNAEVQNIFSAEAMQSQIDDAVANFQKKHPDASQSKIQEFCTEVELRIGISRTKNKYLNSKPNRTARKEHVETALKENGLAILTYKELVKEPLNARKIADEAFPVAKTPALNCLIEDILLAFPILVDVERTVTVVVKTIDMGDDNTRIEFSMALQNPNDQFDALQGKEVAIGRYMVNKILTMYIPNSVIENLGLPKILGVSILSGAALKYREKYL
jgi:hypothetical protein